MTVLGKYYFVQVRLVLQVYDTPQLVSIIKRKSIMSKGNPCPMCSSVKGCLSHEFGKVTFADDRHKLPRNHVLRTCGMKQKCCPKNYYDEDCTQQAEIRGGVTVAKINGHTALTILSKNYTGLKDHITKEAIQPCDEEYADDIISNLRNKDGDYEWFHERYGFAAFIGVLYAAYCDFRPYCPFKRLSQKDYCTFLKTATPKNPVYGFMKPWSFLPLKYMDFGRMINWDSFHSMKNFITNVFHLFMGVRDREKKAAKAKAHYERIQAHPYFWRNSSSSPPWILAKSIQDHVDKFFKSIIYPSNSSHEFSIVELFSNLSQLRGVSIIQAGSIYMDLIVYAIRDGFQKEKQHDRLQKIEPYLCFLSLMGDDLIFLQRPQFDEYDITAIYNRLVELVCLNHLLFGTSEALMCVHQITDLPKFIEQFGPLKGWTTLGMERSISKLKK